MSSWFSENADVHKRALHITAGSSYDQKDAYTVPINSETPTQIESDIAVIEIVVRIKAFVGSAEHKDNSKETSPYFTLRSDSNISIQISLKPEESITADKLLFGNDFGYPIKEFLPYGTWTGLKLFKKYVDPSVEGDLYLDDPYLYGKALSSFNIVSDQTDFDSDGDKKEEVYKFLQKDCLHNEILSVPETSSERQKFFQKKENLEQYIFEKDQWYYFDFVSGLVSLKNSEFTISLPGGYDVNLSKYLNEKFDSLRYVIKKGSDDGNVGVQYGDEILVLNFKLVSLDTPE